MIFSEQLIHLIDEFAKRIGIVIDWTNDNVIPYLHDLITRYGQFHFGYQMIQLLFIPEWFILEPLQGLM